MASHRAVLGVLIALTVLGGALRGYAASRPDPYQSVDERAYARLARNLARHGTYRAPEMKDPTRWAPGAPALFTLAQLVSPAHTGLVWDVPSAYPVQAACGTLLIPALFVLVLLVAGPLAGLVAAGAVAIYPPLVNASGDLLTEPLGTLVLTAALIAVVLALRRPGARSAFVAGAALGAAVLVRADLLLIPVVLALLMGGVAWSRAGRRTGLRALAGALAGSLLLLGPWTAYVSHFNGRFVPVSSGGSSNLFVGTYLPGDGTMFGLKKAYAPRVARALPEYRGQPYWRIPQQRVIDRVAAEHPSANRDAALSAAARENLRKYLIGDPAGYAGMAVRKVGRLWLHYTIGTHDVRLPAFKAYHLFLVLAGILGLAAALALRRGRSGELWAIALVPLYVTAVNIVLVSEARHNLVVMPLLCAGAGIGADLAVRAVRRARALPRAAVGA
jgi:4-amino-4-deoxy-L-arabinose transferase-like glycosyltransferase